MCHWICCGSQLGIYFFLLNKIVSLWSLEFKGQHEIKKKKKTPSSLSMLGCSLWTISSTIEELSCIK
jgi:hypothetical protein